MTVVIDRRLKADGIYLTVKNDALLSRCAPAQIKFVTVEHRVREVKIGDLRY
ncbi:MAG: hypothetical protein Cpurp_12945 [Chlorogloea purpurea SAG 13.99]|nr:hypothetical protein [Chlorogloea purpurea SAG 13.99]